MKSILKRPLITEKTLTQAGKGWYTFEVDAKGTKHTIEDAINSFYSVSVTEVRTMMMHGKVRRVGKKQRSLVKPNWKKTMVRLKAGQKIDAFEVPTTEQPEPAKKK